MLCRGIGDAEEDDTSGSMIRRAPIDVGGHVYPWPISGVELAFWLCTVAIAIMIENGA
jgi:hypothetical protein